MFCRIARGTASLDIARCTRLRQAGKRTRENLSLQDSHYCQLSFYVVSEITASWLESPGLTDEYGKTAGLKIFNALHKEQRPTQ